MRQGHALKTRNSPETEIVAARTMHDWDDLIQFAGGSILAEHGIFATGMRAPSQLRAIVDVGAIQQDSVSIRQQIGVVR